MKIAICIVTFLRDKLLKETVQSILKYWQDEYTVLIVDNGHPTKEKSDYFNSLDQDKVKYFIKPYDCGLSACRNFMVDYATKNNIKYCWMSADSIQFTEKYNLKPIIEFLEEDPRRGMVECVEINAIPWAYDLELIKGECFYLKKPRREPIIFKGIKFQPCDIIRNFFIAKTESINYTKWDEKLKLGEHEDYFYRLMNNYKSFTEEYGTDIYQPYQVFSCDYIKATYLKVRPDEYNLMRRRMYGEFRRILKQKYKIKGWVKYQK